MPVEKVKIERGLNKFSNNIVPIKLKKINFS